MASLEQEHLQECINAVPPVADVKLVGYVVVAEWRDPDGQKLPTRLVGGETSGWAAKGYMHEGLYGLWPADKAHHNPGHSGTWTKLNPDTTGDQGS